ncbi:MAG TPA: LPS assembly protein LptD [Candidatus Angelobacter sp.]|nr:LPS assembly protein LptD [Candidatus Angelobacter sp.]
MHSQHKLVITAALLCHLFVGATLVTSQARPDPSAEAAASSVQQSTPLTQIPGQISPTPTPTPSPTPQPTTAPVPTPTPPIGNCHSIITSPPKPQEVAKSGAATSQSNAKNHKVPISAESPVIIDADECEKSGNVYKLSGNVRIHSEDYDFRADSATYDSSSAEATAKGNVSLDGGHRDLHLTATEAFYNTRTHTGKFYNVHGSTGARFKGRTVTLTSSSPLSFSGKVVEQTGPDEYVLYHGSVTSCELPRPKWSFNAAKIILLVGRSAHIHNSSFRLKGVPVFYLPYVSPPVERLGRQSGFLIPNFGTSNTKGTVIGDSFYWAINRSMDATLGGEYLSKRGWELQENFRARPSQNASVNLNYFGVLDRGITTSSVNAQGQTVSQTTKQGGEDVKLNAGTIFAHDVRGVASVEYLSSFVFRLAFAENFSQAVDSEVKSSAFLTKSVNGFSFNSYLARYQNFQSTLNDDVITILHTPGFEFTGVDRPIFRSPLYWSYDVAADGVRRSQPASAPNEPGFVTPGIVGRFDVDPAITLPIFYKGWTFRTDLQLRNTTYSQQQLPAQPVDIDLHNALNRRSISTSIELRPPVLSRIFDRTIAGRKIKHTIEPRLIYRYTNGIENFSHIIRFDYRDILTNTNELEYGLTQRLFLKREHAGCNDEPTSGPSGAATQAIPPAPCVPAGADEFVTWEVKMKYFGDPNFGGAVQNGTRNVFTTSVNFTGIAFITSPRHFSPVVSLFRVRTTSNSDLQWQLDYDTVKGHINSSTLYAGFHFGDFTVGASHAYLQVPGEVVTNPATGQALPTCVPHVFNQPTCVAPLFNQLRGQLGYGSPTKRGWSAAGSAGFDREFNLLQYAAAQTAYNWDCCGVSFEYRRFSLGSVRNENQYRFAFTLANIGSFGNLKRQERLF